MTTKERPIIFDGESVRAILAGNKTQTRRVVKHPTINNVIRVHSYKGQTEFDLIMGDESGTVIACPYGHPGDRLWVRETWAAEGIRDTHLSIQYKSTPMPPTLGKRVVRPAGFELKMPAQGPLGDDDGIWRTPIYMPRWASRITLEITDIRTQRLQEISEADCAAELGTASNAYTAFMQRWNAINNKRGYSWMMNPWVWVVEFKVI